MQRYLDTSLVGEVISENHTAYAGGYRCFDCLTTRLNHYMVHDDLWLKAWPTYEADRKLMKTIRCVLYQGTGGNSHGCFLCFQCLETRIARKLALEDFKDVPINDSIKFGYAIGQRGPWEYTHEPKVSNL